MGASFQGQMTEIVNRLSSDVEESDQVARTSLSSMNLPGSLKDLETPQELPEHLRTRIHQFQQFGGVERVKSTFNVAQNYSQEAAHLLDVCQQILREEEEMDSSMRATYHNQWALPASHLANTKLQAEIDQYRGNLHHAEKSDSLVRVKFERIQDSLQKLSSPSGVSSLLPAAEPPSAETQQCVAELRKDLNRVEDLITERESLLKEILTATDADQVTHSLMDQENPQSIIDEELAKFKSIEVEIQRNIDEQKTLLDELAATNEKFIRSKSAGNSKREEAVTRIETNLNTCQEILHNLGEGAHFYKQFCELLTTLKGQCDRFLNDRKSAKVALEARLSHGSYGSGGSSHQYGQPPMYNFSGSQQGAPSSQQAYGSGGGGSYQLPAKYYQPVSTPHQQQPQQPPQYQPHESSNQQQEYIQVQGPDGKAQYIPASSIPYYRP